MFTYIVRIENKCLHISLTSVFEIITSFGRRDTGDNNVALLFQINDERESKRSISTQNNFRDRSISG